MQRQSLELSREIAVLLSQLYIFLITFGKIKDKNKRVTFTESKINVYSFERELF